MEKIIQTMIVSVLLVAVVGFAPVFQVALSNTVDEMNLKNSESRSLTKENIKHFFVTFRKNFDIKNHPNYKGSKNNKKQNNKSLKFVKDSFRSIDIPTLNIVLLR